MTASGYSAPGNAYSRWKMLIIKRKRDEAIVITPQDGVDTSQTIAQLFADGPIEITLREVGNRAVRLAIEAPPQLKIWRDAKPRKPDTDDTA